MGFSGSGVIGCFVISFFEKGFNGTETPMSFPHLFPPLLGDFFSRFLQAPVGAKEGTKQTLHREVGEFDDAAPSSPDLPFEVGSAILDRLMLRWLPAFPNLSSRLT